MSKMGQGCMENNNLGASAYAYMDQGCMDDMSRASWDKIDKF